MIELAQVTRQFTGSARPAVADLTLSIRTGETCVLIGPSGCGKTTTLRLVNRLEVPDAGSVSLDGRDIAMVDPVTLRRSIGYVIQQGGLFPHWTLARNIATVPTLLGWDAKRIDARIDELLALVGMEPAHDRNRYPRDLSGGQRQRIGVARALAADPPVLLMDEPFGALDPLTRARLQDELLAILQKLRKTVVFVTHDMDEALRLADRIAFMRDGRLVQYASPATLLAHPADDFVASFVGSDRSLRQLSLVRVAQALSPVIESDAAPLPATASLHEALARMLAEDRDALCVADAQGRVVGSITLASIRAHARRTGAIDSRSNAP